MTAAPTTTWSARRDPRFVALMTGVTVNNIGEGVYALAVPLLAYALTDSLPAMSLVAAAVPVALLLGGPAFGHVVDRYGTKLLFLPGLALQCAAALALVLPLSGGGRPSLVLLVASEFFVQLGGAMYRAAWFASVPRIFTAEPGRARGLLATSFQATVVAGPLLGGALIVPLGVTGLLWINVVTFVAPAGVWLAGVRVPPEKDGGGSSRGMWGSLGEAWRILRGDRRAFTAMLLLIPCSVLASKATLALGVFYLRDGGGLSESASGVAVTVINVGALLGAALAARRRRLRLHTVAALALVAMSAGFVAAQVPAAAVTTGALAVVFGAEALLSTAAEVMLYDSMPADAIGRTYGFFRLVLGSASALAPALIAAVDALLDVRAVFIALALCAAAPLPWLLRRSSRGWDTPVAASDELSGGTT